jgi:hypothetical protein
MAKNSTGIENEPYQGSWVEAIKWLSRRGRWSSDKESTEFL